MCFKDILFRKKSNNLVGDDKMDFIQDFCSFYNAISITIGETVLPEYIYHYTSSGGAKGIFENSTLRFTDRCFLNDQSEGQYVLELCRNNINRIIPDESKFKERFLHHLEEKRDVVLNDSFRVYQCSFSANSDSLCMWNYYTKSNGVKGYSMQFKTLGLTDRVLPKYEREDKKPHITLGKVIYDKEVQLSIIKKIVDKFANYENEHGHYDFIASYAVRKILQQGTFFKQSCFEIEEEYRLVLTLYLEGNEFIGVSNKAGFMERNDIFIPYIDIDFEPDSLTGVTISPTLDSETTRLSIKLISQMKFNHLKDDDIKASEIPVRY